MLVLGFGLLAGCSSLSPRAAMQGPEYGGGFEVSDDVRGVLACMGPAFYVVGEWLGGCH